MKTDMKAILKSRSERDEQQGKIPRLYLRDAIEVQLEVARREL